MNFAWRCRARASAAPSASGPASTPTRRATRSASELECAAQRDWLPSEADRAFVKSLMQRVIEPGKMAGWLAPPERGINNLPVDYEYVRLN